MGLLGGEGLGGGLYGGGGAQNKAPFDRWAYGLMAIAGWPAYPQNNPSFIKPIQL